MLSSWHDLLFNSLASPTILSSSLSFYGLVVWVWGLWTDTVFSLSPGLAQQTPNNNNNNNNQLPYPMKQLYSQNRTSGTGRTLKDNYGTRCNY